MKKPDLRKIIEQYTRLVASAVYDEELMSAICSPGRDELESFLNAIARVQVAKAAIALTGRDSLSLDAKEVKEIFNIMHSISAGMISEAQARDTTDAEFLNEALGSTPNPNEEFNAIVAKVVTETIKMMETEPGDLDKTRILH